MEGREEKEGRKRWRGGLKHGQEGKNKGRVGGRE